MTGFIPLCGKGQERHKCMPIPAARRRLEQCENLCSFYGALLTRFLAEKPISAPDFQGIYKCPYWPAAQPSELEFAKCSSFRLAKSHA